MTKRPFCGKPGFYASEEGGFGVNKGVCKKKFRKFSIFYLQAGEIRCIVY